MIKRRVLNCVHVVLPTFASKAPIMKINTHENLCESLKFVELQKIMVVKFFPFGEHEICENSNLTN